MTPKVQAFEPGSDLRRDVDRKFKFIEFHEKPGNQGGNSTDLQSLSYWVNLPDSVAPGIDETEALQKKKIHWFLVGRNLLSV